MEKSVGDKREPCRRPSSARDANRAPCALRRVSSLVLRDPHLERPALHRPGLPGVERCQVLGASSGQ
jgi:hypothetical protein